MPDSETRAEVTALSPEKLAKTKALILRWPNDPLNDWLDTFVLALIEEIESRDARIEELEDEIADRERWAPRRSGFHV